jgi:hypothetical protein
VVAILDLEKNLGGPPNVIARIGAEHITFTEELLAGKNDSFQSRPTCLRGNYNGHNIKKTCAGLIVCILSGRTIQH